MTAGTDIYRGEFEAHRAALPGAGLDWLAALRTAAIDRFAADGFPGPKVEEWKFVNVGALSDRPYRLALDEAPAAQPAIDRIVARYEAAPLLAVYVNGRLNANASRLAALPDGVRVRDLATALAETPDKIQRHLSDLDTLAVDRLSGRRDSRPFSLAAMNTALMTGGAVVEVARGIAAPEICIVHIAAAGDDAAMVQLRNLCIVEQAASASLFEAYEGATDTGHWTNAMTECAVADGASLTHNKLIAEPASALHVSAGGCRVERAGRYHQFTMAAGGRVARSELRVDLAGPGAECRLDGLFLGRDGQQVDILTLVDHRSTHGTTHETYKGIVAGTARAAFQGKIRVWPDAIKTEAHQANHNLLLSEQARVDSKPELEILADDVQCSHGSTVGSLDQDALFYLRSRGMELGTARELLLRAFANQLIETVTDDCAAHALAATLGAWLEAV